MTKQEIRQRGIDAGYQAAIYTEVSDSDREQAGCICIEAEDITDQAECAECISAAAYESEQNARSYSPFEHLAHAINESRDPESQWDAYDAGVEAGIKRGIEARLRKVSA
jgi:hypothetical protein